MAVARILCGACDSPLSMLDRSCPKCGEPVELLSASSPPVSRSADGAAAGASRPSGIQRWQLVAGAIVVVLLALFGYLEFTRPVPPGGTAGGAVPAMGGGVPVLQELARLEEAVRTAPRDPAALIALANALHDIGMADPSRLEQAIETYRRYLVLRPEDPNARVDMGICSFEMARTDSAHSAAHIRDAIREMTAAFRIDSLHQPAAFNLGVVNLYAANTAESARWFTKAIAIAPETELGKRARSLLDQHAVPSPTQ